MSTLVETSCGRIEGRVEAGIHGFRGIPYAAPPTGTLRFRAPEPTRSLGLVWRRASPRAEAFAALGAELRAAVDRRR